MILLFCTQNPDGYRIGYHRRGVEIMILRKIGKGVLTVFKAIVWLILETLNLLFGVLKLFLLLFGLVAKVVLEFV